MMKIEKKVLVEAGYGPEMAQAQLLEQFQGEWGNRPRFAIINSRLHYCEFRCLQSHFGGGSCNCFSHSPEVWMEVI